MSTLRTLHRREEGSISFFLVFGLITLALLVGLIANTGNLTAGKVRMQGTADAVTVSSATWVARGLNVHSAINVFQTQLVGGAINMHALHQAMEITHPIACGIAQVCCNCMGGPQCIVCCPCCVLYAGTWGLMYAVEFPLGKVAQWGSCAPPDGGLGLCKALAEDGSDGTGGLFWKTSNILETANRAVQPAFTALATYQSQEVARANGASFGWVATLRSGDPMEVADNMKGLLAWVPSKQGTKEDFCRALDEGAPGYQELHGYSETEGGPWRAGSIRGLVPSATGLLVGAPALFAIFTRLDYDRLCTPGMENATATNIPVTGEVDEDMPGIPVRPQTAAACQAKDGFSQWATARYRFHSNPLTFTNEQGQTFTDVHDPHDDDGRPVPANPAPAVDASSTASLDLTAGGAPQGVTLNPDGTVADQSPAERSTEPDSRFVLLSQSTEEKSCSYDPTSEHSGLRLIKAEPRTYQRNTATREVEVQPHVDPVRCPEHCSNGADDDLDGLVDCADTPDCDAACNTPRTETACDDGRDEDADGFRDCLDLDCRGAGPCASTAGENCWNGADDDDLDTAADCADSECAGRSGCPSTSGENCWNGADDDGDALTDCADAACAGVAECVTCTPAPEIPRKVAYVYEVETWSFEGYWTDETDFEPANAKPLENSSGQTRIPLPMVIDLDDPDERGNLKFVGIATGTSPTKWASGLFGRGPAFVTFASAEVYNDISEDLWTQDWRVRLVPADLSSPQVVAALTALTAKEGGTADAAIFGATGAAGIAADALDAGEVVNGLSHH